MDQIFEEALKQSEKRKNKITPRSKYDKIINDLLRSNLEISKVSDLDSIALETGLK